MHCCRKSLTWADLICTGGNLSVKGERFTRLEIIPPKSNIDAKHIQKWWFFKCISFQIWLFWISMFPFGGVWKNDMPCTTLQGTITYPTKREKENHRLKSAVLGGYVSSQEFKLEPPWEEFDFIVDSALNHATYSDIAKHSSKNICQENKNLCVFPTSIEKTSLNCHTFLINYILYRGWIIIVCQSPCSMNKDNFMYCLAGIDPTESPFLLFPCIFFSRIPISMVISKSVIQLPG